MGNIEKYKEFKGETVPTDVPTDSKYPHIHLGAN
jgi:hypothetical protein